MDGMIAQLEGMLEASGYFFPPDRTPATRRTLRTLLTKPGWSSQEVRTLRGVLSGQILVQNHCYRADEMAIMIDIAKEFGYRIRAFHHASEAYKIADLLRETQDLHLVVVPEINAGTASLAYAAINPVIGLGTFLAQYLLRQPLQQAGTREFRVHGPWDKPQVDPVERRAAPAAPTASDAAAR